jgi:hypothetical protein
MPKRALILLGAIALGLAIPACNNASSPTPTPAPSASFTPNPKITNATIQVTVQQSPAAKIPVQESTPKPSAGCKSGNQLDCRPGTAFLTQKTDKKGSTVFHNLKPSQTYCWVAVLGPNQSSSTCAGWQIWQFEPITIGT